MGQLPTLSWIGQAEISISQPGDGYCAAPEGLLYGKLPDGQQPPAPVGKFTWHLDTNQLHDAWLVVTWGAA